VGGAAPLRFAARPGARDIELIALLTDTARFRPNDPDALVSASLACPVCLCADTVRWDGSLQGYDPSVLCRCSSCHQRWLVYLAPEQALRLGLMPVHAG
jgi:hypothetical protein